MSHQISEYEYGYGYDYEYEYEDYQQFDGMQEETTNESNAPSQTSMCTTQTLSSSSVSSSPSSLSTNNEEYQQRIEINDTLQVSSSSSSSSSFGKPYRKEELEEPRRRSGREVKPRDTYEPNSISKQHLLRPLVEYIYKKCTASTSYPPPHTTL